MLQFLYHFFRWVSRNRAALVLCFVCLIVFGGLVSFPTLVSADTTDFGIGDVDQQIDLSGDSIIEIILRVIRVLLGFLGLILVSMIIYAGYVIMTSAGIEERVERGKVILRNAVIGTVIILFSFAIVQFVITLLGDASGAGNRDGGGGAPTLNSFFGVGSLGTVIKDHYPRVDQTDVYRNTKIVITFRDEIEPSSLIVDENENNTYGDCIDVDGTQVCDAVRSESIAIYRIDDKSGTVQGNAIVADARASYEGVGVLHTIVLKPRELLGNDQADAWHRVIISDDVLTIDGDSIFAGRSEGLYRWEFQTNTEVDLTPPYVVDVSPNPGESVAKNHILRITFNEPVDPMGVQGVLGPGATFSNIAVDMNGITDNTDQTSIVGGEWRVTNGYQTVEFVSDEACGINSCGEEIFCLPTGCAVQDATCSASYTVLARTASLQDANGNSFVSAGFLDGVTDLADNALDSDFDSSGTAPVLGKPDTFSLYEGDGWRHKPPFTGDRAFVSASELFPDNFWWTFTVQNTIDTSIPYVRQVEPGIDQQGVASYTPVEVHFSKEMWTDTLSDVVIEEHPDSGLGIGFHHLTAEPSGGTILSMPHPARPFGVGGDRYYFTSIPGTVKAVNQFCLYPGRGPVADAPQTGISEPACEITYDDNWNIIEIVGCAPGNDVTSDTDTGCVTTVSGWSNASGSVEACVDAMREESSSVFITQ